MLNSSIKKALPLILCIVFSACAIHQPDKQSHHILNEYTNNLTDSDRQSANGFINFLRSEVYKNGELDNFPEFAVILYDAKPEHILLSLGFNTKRDWVDMDIGFSAPNRMLIVEKTKQWPRFVLNVGLPGAGGVTTQTAELAALGVKQVLHIGTAGLLSDRASGSKILLGENAYKDGAAVMLSTPDSHGILKLAKPDLNLANRIKRIGNGRVEMATGYTIPIFYYQPSKLLAELVQVGKFNDGPLIDYMEMEQAPFYQTCQLARIACASLVIGSDRTFFKNGKIATDYFNHDIQARKAEALTIALDVFTELREL